MKNTSKRIVLLCLMATLYSCEKDKPSNNSEEKGTLVLNLEVDIDVFDLQKQAKSTNADVNEFYVRIYTTDDELILSYDAYSDVPSEIELSAGSYYATAGFGTSTQVGFEMPNFFGQSDNFTLTAGGSELVTIDCSITNCAVSVVYSQNITDNYTDYSTEVTCTEGSLTFNETEVRYGYFPLLPLTITATLSNDSDTKTLTGMIASPVAGKLYEINLDVAIDPNGASLLTVNLDETLDPEVIEISDISASTKWEGALLITEIMFDPSGTESEGEWFELYNPTDSIIHLQDMTVKDASSTGEFTITAEINLNPGEYCLMARNAAVLTNNPGYQHSFVYGSISLNNTTEDLYLYALSGELINEVSYNGSSFDRVENESIQQYPETSGNWCVASGITPGLANEICKE